MIIEKQKKKPLTKKAMENWKYIYYYNQTLENESNFHY